MRLLGQYDDQENLIKYGEPIKVYRIGNELRAVETDVIWGVRYRDYWVSPGHVDGFRAPLKFEGE